VNNSANLQKKLPIGGKALDRKKLLIKFKRSGQQVVKHEN
jgi:hypothetical protein